MDWVHCNKCFTQPGEEKEKHFWLTNCRHIFCDACLAHGPNGYIECHMCKKRCSTHLLKPSNLNGELKDYFTSLDSFFDKVIKISEFQNDHRMKLAQHHRNIVKKTKILAKKNKEIFEEINDLQRKISILEKENNLMENFSNQSTSSTPKNFHFRMGSVQSQPSFFNGTPVYTTSKPAIIPQKMFQVRSAGACLQKALPSQKLLPCSATRSQNVSSTQRDPPSQTSSTHSINVCGNRKPHTPYLMSPSPSHYMKKPIIPDSTPDYISNLRNLSFLQGKHYKDHSGK